MNDGESSSLDAALDQALLANADDIKKYGVVLQREALDMARMPSEPLAKLMSQLVNNAIKFSRSEDVPKIEIGPLNDTESGEIGFYIRDNGIGIALHYSKRIFGVFERLHTEQDYEGNGIGLAICRRILDEYDGRIVLVSEDGAGAEFRVYLPAV